MPVYVKPRVKGPKEDGWQNQRLTEADLAAHFGRPGNIGIILGKASGDLVDVDLDCLEALDLADRFLPPTPAETGRPTTPRSHRWYVADVPATTQFRDPKTGKMIVELRSTGGQTLVGPSRHDKTDEPYDVLDGEPAHVAAPMLAACVNALCEEVLRRRYGTVPEKRPGAAPARHSPPADMSQADLERRDAVDARLGVDESGIGELVRGFHFRVLVRHVGHLVEQVHQGIHHLAFVHRVPPLSRAWSACAPHRVASLLHQIDEQPVSCNVACCADVPVDGVLQPPGQDAGGLLVDIRPKVDDPGIRLRPVQVDHQLAACRSDQGCLAASALYVDLSHLRPRVHRNPFRSNALRFQSPLRQSLVGGPHQGDSGGIRRCFSRRNWRCPKGLRHVGAGVRRFFRGPGRPKLARSRQGGGGTSQTPPTPTALTVAQMAKVLSAAGGRRIIEAVIRADIDAGAPVNSDGTLNLVHYAAWLAREVARGD